MMRLALVCLIAALTSVSAVHLPTGPNAGPLVAVQCVSCSGNDGGPVWSVSFLNTSDLALAPVSSVIVNTTELGVTTMNWVSYVTVDPATKRIFTVFTNQNGKDWPHIVTTYIETGQSSIAGAIPTLVYARSFNWVTALDRLVVTIMDPRETALSLHTIDSVDGSMTLLNQHPIPAKLGAMSSANTVSTFDPHGQRIVTVVTQLAAKPPLSIILATPLSLLGSQTTSPTLQFPVNDPSIFSDVHFVFEQDGVWGGDVFRLVYQYNNTHVFAGHVDFSTGAITNSSPQLPFSFPFGSTLSVPTQVSPSTVLYYLPWSRTVYLVDMDDPINSRSLNLTDPVWAMSFVH